MEKIMKCVLLILILLSFAGLVQAQNDDLNQAVAACTNGDFPAAIAAFEAAVSTGTRDSSLYYNLGMCYSWSGQPGKALVNLLRAEVTAPRDNDIHLQMDRLRAERADLPEDETDVITLAGTITQRVTTAGELAFLAFFAWTTFFAQLIVRLLRPGWMTWLRYILFTASIVLIIMLLLMGCRFYVENNRPAAVVIVPTAQAMSGPGDDYLPLFALSEAAEVRILETRTGWCRVVLPGGRQGWIPQERLGIVNL